MQLKTWKDQERRAPADPTGALELQTQSTPDRSYFVLRVGSLKPDQSAHPRSSTETNAAIYVVLNFLAATLQKNNIGFNNIYPSIFKLLSFP